jgi:hypothetical protein
VNTLHKGDDDDDQDDDDDDDNNNIFANSEATSLNIQYSSVLQVTFGKLRFRLCAVRYLLAHRSVLCGGGGGQI